MAPTPRAPIPSNARSRAPFSYVYLPIFFQLAKGETASQTGISMIPMMLAMPVGASLCGIALSVFPKLDCACTACALMVLCVARRAQRRGK